MAASPVLVDSSFYIARLRQGIDFTIELLVISAVRDLVTCGMVACEVGRGLRDPRLREKLRSYWDAMLYVPTDKALWQEAEDLLRKLDREGRAVPPSDAVIGCCARRVNAVVLTLDQHFAIIPGITAVSKIV
jgi:predicted nucleic acid-binding protein